MKKLIFLMSILLLMLTACSSRASNTDQTAKTEEPALTDGPADITEGGKYDAVQEYKVYAQELTTINYKNIVADSGYESEENYIYLEENKQLALRYGLNLEEYIPPEYSFYLCTRNA